MTNYEKELNHLKERILKDGDTLVSKRDLLERFCEVDEAYNSDPWNLLQILTNINILIGEEPCEDAVSRQAVIDLVNAECVDLQDGSEVWRSCVNDTVESIYRKVKALPLVKPTSKKGKWIIDDKEYNRIWHCHCSNCKKDPQDYIGGTENWWLVRLPNYCPNCGSYNKGD